MEASLPGGLDRYVVAENGADIVEATFFVSHGNQSPVAAFGRDFAAKDWRASSPDRPGAMVAATPASKAAAASRPLLELDMTPDMARAAADNCFCRWRRA